MDEFTGSWKGVAPLVGAWIEMHFPNNHVFRRIVAPLVGAWIEILLRATALKTVLRSLPLWERGLKSVEERLPEEGKGRSPCGSVD